MEAIQNLAETPQLSLFIAAPFHMPEGRGIRTGRPTTVDSSLVGDVEQLLLGEGTTILDIQAWRTACSADLQDRVSRALLRGRGPQLELGVEPRPGGAPGGW